MQTREIGLIKKDNTPLVELLRKVIIPTRNSPIPMGTHVRVLQQRPEEAKTLVDLGYEHLEWIPSDSLCIIPETIGETIIGGKYFLGQCTAVVVQTGVSQSLTDCTMVLVIKKNGLAGVWVSVVHGERHFSIALSVPSDTSVILCE